MAVGNYDGGASSTEKYSSTEKCNDPFDGLIRSLGDAERMLKKWDADDPGTVNVPDKIMRCISTTDGSMIPGTIDEYRGLAAEFDRRGMYDKAAFVADEGANLWRGNVDLLADSIKYAAKARDWRTCTTAFERLKTNKCGKFNGYAFSCVYDYLKARMEAGETPGALVKELSDLFAMGRDIGYDGAAIAEAEWYLDLGRLEQAIEALNRPGAGLQCQTKLVELLLHAFREEEAVIYATRALRQLEPGVPAASIGYLVYLSALAKDAIVFREELGKPEYIEPGSRGDGKVDYNADHIDPDHSGFKNLGAVHSALVDYSIAADLLKDNALYRDTIAARMLLLKKKSGIE